MSMVCDVCRCDLRYPAPVAERRNLEHHMKYICPVCGLSWTFDTDGKLLHRSNLPAPMVQEIPSNHAKAAEEEAEEAPETVNPETRATAERMPESNPQPLSPPRPTASPTPRRPVSRLNPFERIRQSRGWSWNEMLIAMDLSPAGRRYLGARFPLFKTLPKRIQDGLVLIGENPLEVAIEYQKFRQAYAQALRRGKDLS